MITAEYGKCPKCGNEECCVTRDETGELWNCDVCGYVEDISYLDDEEDYYDYEGYYDDEEA